MGKLSQLKLEQLRKAEKEAKIQALLRENKKRHSKTNKVLNKIIAGDLKSKDFPTNSGLASVCDLIQNNKSHQKKSFVELLEFLMNGKAKTILDDDDLVDGLWNMAKNSGRWIRNIENWKPKFYNAEKLFTDLSAFLFAKYPVPTFLNEAWLENNSKYIAWFLHIGEGQNIRKAKDLPIQLSKKMAHQFLKAPNHYSVVEAIRFAQITGMGGDKKLVPLLLGTRIGQGFEEEEFVEGVIRFFINNTDKINPVDIQPIVDYVFTQKFETRQLVIERGVYENLPPAQPDFSMKGRTVEALLRQVKAWHEELAKAKKRKHFMAWEPFYIDDFIWKEKSANDWEGIKTYKITQLLTSTELWREGRKMHHCVGSYARRCDNGDTSIWSMTVKSEFNKETSLVTIELDKSRNIQQVRGKYNAWATREVIKVLKIWCKAKDLRFPHWLDN